jgi:hypothetical protein
VSLCLIGCSRSNPLACCGLDPQTRRVLSSWVEPNRQISLTATFGEDRHGKIFIDVGVADGQGKWVYGAYASTEYGNSWQRRSMATLGYRNLAVRSGPGFFSRGIMSSQDPRLLFRDPATFRFKFEMSHDGGRSWEEVSPQLKSGGTVRNFELIATGMQNSERIYAQIRLSGVEEDFSLYRSDDCGRTFVELSNEVSYAVESRADPDLLVGITNVRPGLPIGIALSKDGGTHWKRIPSEILMEPLVTDGGQPPVIRTWVENDARDSYIKNDFQIVQIETDPSDKDTFYIVTGKGLFATRDQGKTFKLLPLAIEYVQAIESIAVDPSDGRYVYASVRKSELYRSMDRGCSWTKLASPKP